MRSGLISCAEQDHRFRSANVSYKTLFRSSSIFAVTVFLALCASATERGVMIRNGVIYISPDQSSATLSDISRGREVAVVEHTPGWIHVVATVEEDLEEETQRNITGWL